MLENQLSYVASYNFQSICETFYWGEDESTIAGIGCPSLVSTTTDDFADLFEKLVRTANIVTKMSTGSMPEEGEGQEKNVLDLLTYCG